MQSGNNPEAVRLTVTQWNFDILLNIIKIKYFDCSLSHNYIFLTIFPPIPYEASANFG